MLNAIGAWKALTDRQARIAELLPDASDKERAALQAELVRLGQDAATVPDVVAEAGRRFALAHLGQLDAEAVALRGHIDDLAARLPALRDDREQAERAVFVAEAECNTKELGQLREARDAARLAVEQAERELSGSQSARGLCSQWARDLYGADLLDKGTWRRAAHDFGERERAKLSKM
jgi:chromosome segregation ATPase